MHVSELGIDTLIYRVARVRVLGGIQCVGCSIVPYAASIDTQLNVLGPGSACGGVAGLENDA